MLGFDVHASTQPDVCVRLAWSRMKYGLRICLKKWAHTSPVGSARHPASGSVSFISLPPVCPFKVSPSAAVGQPASPGRTRCNLRATAVGPARKTSGKVTASAPNKGAAPTHFSNWRRFIGYASQLLGCNRIGKDERLFSCPEFDVENRGQNHTQANHTDDGRQHVAASDYDNA